MHEKTDLSEKQKQTGLSKKRGGFVSFAQLIIVKFLSEGGNWAGRLGISAFSEAL